MGDKHGFCESVVHGLSFPFLSLGEERKADKKGIWVAARPKWEQQRRRDHHNIFCFVLSEKKFYRVSKLGHSFCLPALHINRESRDAKVMI